ncbi:MAG: hypothetical protein U1F11_01815 [Steroidobacteraceae bacterium]
MSAFRRSLQLRLLLLLLLPLPVATAWAAGPEFRDFEVVDVARGGRVIPIRVWLPESHARAPVVLYSHGLGGSREGNAYLGAHWAAHGYVVVYLQHPGSDAAVWQDVPPARRRAAMRAAADLRNFLLRVRDVPAVLDELARWNAPGSAHPLSQRLDLGRIGMSGHSFGAVTTQAVSGQRFPAAGRGRSFTDPRIKAALMMSPSTPRRGDAASAFGRVAIPWLLMTGTADVAPIGQATLESRRAVYPALPPGGKYELVLDGAEHSAFGDRPLPGDARARNPNHHRAILALSTAFWDAYLRDDAQARAWLDGVEATRVLEPRDLWQRK